jgi:transcriptional regulator with XRE-family HTH domain
MIYVAASETVSDMESMGDRLRKARLTKYASANQAAKAIGVAASTLRAHENGQNKFGTEEAELYARRFGTTPGYLLTGEAPTQRMDGEDETPLRTAAEIRRMLNRIDDLTRDERDTIAAMIDTLQKANRRAGRSQNRSDGRSELATSRRGL